MTQDAAEAAVLCLINEERVAAGIPALTLNLKLRTAARQHANDARTLRWWAGGGPKIHVNPVTGSTPQDRIKAAEYCPGEETPPMNENGYDAYYKGGVQFQTGTTPEAAVTWWMSSQDHRTTLLDPIYTESGVAVVLGVAQKGPEADAADGGAIFVQTFGGCSIPEPVNVGEVWTWGQNSSGQLGDATTIVRLLPVHPARIGPVAAVAGGAHHSVALMTDGSLSAWGQNAWGQLGDGTTTGRLIPVPVPSLTGVTAIAAGGFHTLALMSDGSVMAWGLNQWGQLGDGTNTNRSAPGQVPNLHDVIAIAGGLNHSLALTSDGRVLTWGQNDFGQLGDGTTNSRSTPAQVAELSSVKAISGGWEHSLALKTDGSVWAWGENNQGQVGDNTHTRRLTPVKVAFSPSVSAAIVVIAAGGVHNLALEQSGRVWTWGGNAFGQLGTGDTIDRSTPVQPVNVHEVSAIAADWVFSLALRQDGTVWGWGSNSSGQLGDNTTINRSTPVQVLGLPSVSAIAAGGFHSLAT
jgi:alpha-tubulin suppressor-like RCC1 family protein/uncharacterized protein YkwD